MPSISQFTSIAHSCPPHCDPKYWSTPGSPVHHQFPELTLTHVHRAGDAIQPSHPLSSPSLSTFNLSHHQFRISPANEYSGLIIFTIDWLDLPAIQGTLKSLLQHDSSKASILLCSAFYMVQISLPYMTPEETLA